MGIYCPFVWLFHSLFSTSLYVAFRLFLSLELCIFILCNACLQGKFLEVRLLDQKLYITKFLSPSFVCLFVFFNQFTLPQQCLNGLFSNWMCYYCKFGEAGTVLYVRSCIFNFWLSTSLLLSESDHISCLKVIFYLFLWILYSCLSFIFYLGFYLFAL